MSDVDTDEVLVVPDELAALKARADLLSVKYHPSISLEKLRIKVNASVEGVPVVEPEPVVPPVVVAETDTQRRVRCRREATELIRVRITCMNPAKKEWEGELFTCGNSLVGSFTKFIPFNNEEGWHVPRIILNQIEDRQCQVFVSVRDTRGNTTRKGKLIKEFAVEVLPTLTATELSELARKQAMSNSID